MSSATTILSLPNELLIAVAEVDQHDRHVYYPTTQKSEWILSQVCRRFREALTGAPALWSNIAIGTTWIPLKYGERLLERFKLFLRRSTPLKVSINLQVSYEDDVSMLTELWLPEIAAEVDRVERLSFLLNSEHEDLSQVFAPLNQLAAPNLVYLEISSDHMSAFHRCPLEIFSLGAPKLATVRLYSFLPSKMPESWTSSLTRLELGAGLTPDQIDDEDIRSLLLSVVARPIALTYLRLHFPELRLEILGAQTLPWPHLKMLTLCRSSSGEDVRSALQEIAPHLPGKISKLRLDPKLFFAEDWQENCVDVEVFDPEEMLKLFRKFYA
ncbi:hypothetical protein R3P38DRAFT_3340999 [Favolaschia claudopus]|uniref:F-box domain-containing protein n=1 Tax=Favolaschia claudopus TaxID=2862362 RepID=A0AAW0EBR3_9AGAR